MNLLMNIINPVLWTPPYKNTTMWSDNTLPKYCSLKSAPSRDIIQNGHIHNVELVFLHKENFYFSNLKYF